MIFMAAILSVAAVSTVAFQSRPSSCQPSTGGVNHRISSIPINHNPPSSFDWSLSYTSKSNNHAVSTEKVPTLSIHSLLEAGRIDDAAAELLKSDNNEVPASTYHAVIEVCCAGGGFDPKSRQRKNKNEDDRIEIAAELLQSMEDNVTAHAHERIISGYARRGRWQDAYRTLSSMEEAFGPSEDTKNSKGNIDGKDITTPSLNIYQTVLVAFAKANQFNHMNSLLTRMRRRGVRPNVYTYNSLLKICASSASASEALSLLSQCQREPGVKPDLITYTTTMKACARGRQEDKVRELFRAAKDMGMELDVYFYTTAMDACAKGKKQNSWKNALLLLDEMKEKGIAPNEVTYGVAVAACGNGGQWKRALELLDQMRVTDLKINTITYNSAISALSKAARFDSGDSDGDLLWQKAVDLMECMEKEGVRRDSFTFSSAISTCFYLMARQWESSPLMSFPHVPLYLHRKLPPLLHHAHSS